MSGGRLAFRTGAGATLQYASQWWYPFGIDYPTIKERLHILDEGLQVLQKFWNSPSVFFAGDYIKVNGGTLTKTNTPIPITIAAKSEKMMAIAAKYADVWEASYISPDKFKLLFEKFMEISDIVVRRSNKITSSIELDVIIAESDSELAYKEKLFMMDRGPSVYNQILQNGLVGTPDRVRERIKEYVDAGVEQFFLAFHDPFNHHDLELFMDTVK
jgi:alkanesulfonate monooxygenase SsuD/methylene tetrahydromethanopterin reductase-like flavin-dependent oxidoreductase (luciferase family)